MPVSGHWGSPRLPYAQPSNSDISFDPGALAVKKPKPGLPDVKPQPLAWPRLDPGAVLCRTEADLEKLAARRSGQTVNGAIDCQIIRAATAISIVQRKGLGRVEVKISDASGRRIRLDRCVVAGQGPDRRDVGHPVMVVCRRADTAFLTLGAIAPAVRNIHLDGGTSTP